MEFAVNHEIHGVSMILIITALLIQNRHIHHSKGYSTDGWTFRLKLAFSEPLIILAIDVSFSSHPYDVSCIKKSMISSYSECAGFMINLFFYIGF